MSAGRCIHGNFLRDALAIQSVRLPGAVTTVRLLRREIRWHDAACRSCRRYAGCAYCGGRYDGSKAWTRLRAVTKSRHGEMLMCAHCSAEPWRRKVAFEGAPENGGRRLYLSEPPLEIRR